MYLTSWEESFVESENDMPKKANLKMACKVYSFDTINNLTDNGYLYFSKYKNKSVTLTKEGEKLAEALIEKYLNKGE